MKLSLYQAAEQALGDLQMWTTDHPKWCDCLTCFDTIPELLAALEAERAAAPEPEVKP